MFKTLNDSTKNYVFFKINDSFPLYNNLILGNLLMLDLNTDEITIIMIQENVL